MTLEVTQPSRRYQNHHLDSDRWGVYEPRSDDIVITSSYKSGTTWMQSIVRELVVLQQRWTGADDVGSLPLPDEESSPWVEARWGGDLDDLRTRLDSQRHRRFLKTHLPVDAIPFCGEVRYLVLGRDPRDVFLSLWNHYTSYLPAFIDQINGLPGLVGDPLPPPPVNIHDFWSTWISSGAFEWEREGAPFWGNLNHTRAWWSRRQLENVMFVHYSDMLSTPAATIERVACFLDIDLSTFEANQVAERTSLAAMRERMHLQELARGRSRVFKDGSRSFFFRGSNERWRGILAREELQTYEQVRDEILPPAAALWLEAGGWIDDTPPATG